MNLPDVPAPAQGNFLKLADGQAIKAVFVGEMYSFHTKWVNGKSVTVDNKDPEGKIRFRNNLVVIDPATNELTVKIWEFPWGVFESLKAINEEYPLENIKVKISRTGTLLNTEYSILPLVGPKDVLSQHARAAIQAMPLLALEKKATTQQEGPSHDPSDEIPF